MLNALLEHHTISDIVQKEFAWTIIQRDYGGRKHNKKAIPCYLLPKKKPQ